MPGGNQSRLQGDAFEGVISIIHQRYEVHGLACIEKAGTRAVMRKMGDGSYVPIMQPSMPDYGGTLAGGQAVYFDAKSIGKPAWTMPPTRRHLQQWDFMQRMATVGAICFFLVESRPLDLAALLRIRPKIVNPDKRPTTRFGRRGYEADVLLCPRSKEGLYDWIPLVAQFWLSPAPPATVKAPSNDLCGANSQDG